MPRLLDHPIIAQRYFFPMRVPLADPFVVPVDGAELHCWQSPPTGRPTLLHFHGNGEVVADWLDVASTLDALGMDVVFAEYRGYGGSTGEPAMDTMLDDALAVYDAIERPDVYVYGRSVGSLYALHVAAERQVAGLIIESGIADVYPRLALRMRAEELGCTDAALRAALAERFDHRAKVQAHAGPMLVLHAAGDHLVPPHNAEDLASWSDRAELVLFDRGDHNSIHLFNGSDIWGRVALLVGV